MVKADEARERVLWSISAKVLLGFLIAVVAVGSALGYGLYRLQAVEADARLIHHAYVPLSLSLGEARTEVARYDRLIQAQDQIALVKISRAEKSLKSFPRRVRAPLMRARDFVELGLELHPNTRDTKFLQGALTNINTILAEIEALESDSDRLQSALAQSRWTDALTAQSALAEDVQHIDERVTSLNTETRRTIAAAIRQSDLSKHSANITLLVLCSIALLIAVLTALVLRNLLNPLVRLTEATRALGRGEAAPSVAIHRSDELGVLAAEFNGMAKSIQERDSRLRAQNQELKAAYDELVQLRRNEEETKAKLIQKERLAAIGRMAAQVTHELRNPLSSLGLNVEMLEEDINEDSDEARAAARELLADIRAELEHLTHLTDEYLAYARLPTTTTQMVTASHLLEGLVRLVGTEISSHGIDFHLESDEDLTFEADPSQIRRALLNLVRNAIEAMSGGGTLWISAKANEDRVRIEVQDTGPGIDSSLLEDVFEPFYTTKSTGNGLGLHLTRQIMEEHHGSLQVMSDAAGTTFVIDLPRVHQSPTNDDS